MRKALPQVLLLSMCMLLLSALFCPPRAYAVARYRITSLSTLIGPNVTAKAMNDHRQIIGHKYDPVTRTYQAFRWTPGRGMDDLGSLSQWNLNARAINNLGQVVGSYRVAGQPGDVGLVYHGFLWTESDGTQDLGTLSGSTYSEAYDINDSGQIAGFSGGSIARWDGTTINDAGAGGGISASINGSGRIAAGLSVYDPDGTQTSLERLPGTDYQWTFDMNDSGWVVGEGYFSQEDECHFGIIWNADGVATRLGALYPAHSSYATGINNRGEVVGRSKNTGVIYKPDPPGWPHAFIWTASGGMKDLNTMLSYSQRYWTVQEAIDINNNGEILAKGLNPQGQTDYFMLTIIPEPSSLLALAGGLSAIGLMLRRRR